MNAKKLAKWGRRAVVSFCTDRNWRKQGLCPVWLGSPSGGAFVDVRSLGPDSVVYSFGIATEISFDRAIIKAAGCHVWGFDPDPRSTRWLKAPERYVPEQFHFSELALAVESREYVFHTTDIERMSGSLSRGYDEGEDIHVQGKSLKDIMADNHHALVDYLKMDIEGAEYELLNAWLEEYDLLPVKQLWLEFHPDGHATTERDSVALARKLAKIGMVPGWRNYFRCPNNLLLVNKNLN
jgi:FkbM family methyltransferase